MEEIVVNGLHNFNIDSNDKTIYLLKKHFKETSHKIFNLGGNMLYHIDYYDIKSYIREYLRKYENDGYKIILQHEGKNILIRYNG